MEGHEVFLAGSTCGRLVGGSYLPVTCCLLQELSVEEFVGHILDALLASLGVGEIVADILALVSV